MFIQKLGPTSWAFQLLFSYSNLVTMLFSYQIVKLIGIITDTNMLIIHSIDFLKTWFEDMEKQRVFNFIIDIFLDMEALSFFFFYLVRFHNIVVKFLFSGETIWILTSICHLPSERSCETWWHISVPRAQLSYEAMRTQCLSFWEGRNSQVWSIIFYRKKFKSVYPLCISISVISRIILL